MSDPKLPRGSTWYALWAVPVLLVLALVLVPWSEEPAPVFDPVKMKMASERWQAAMARRQAASAASAAEPAEPASGTVVVRVIPASSPR